MFLCLAWVGRWIAGRGSKDMAEEFGGWDKKCPVSGRTWCLGDTFMYLHGDERFFFK